MKSSIVITGVVQVFSVIIFVLFLLCFGKLTNWYFVGDGKKARTSFETNAFVAQNR